MVWHIHNKNADITGWVKPLWILEGTFSSPFANGNWFLLFNWPKGRVRISFIYLRGKNNDVQGCGRASDMGRKHGKQLEDNRRHQEHMGKVKKFTSWRTFTVPSKLVQSLDGDSNSCPEMLPQIGQHDGQHWQEQQVGTLCRAWWMEWLVSLGLWYNLSMLSVYEDGCRICGLFPTTFFFYVCDDYSQWSLWMFLLQTQTCWK